MKFEKPIPATHKNQQIGEGVEKRAYHLPSDPNSVTLEYKYEYSHEQIKGSFYFQKITNLLFPQYTVKIKQVGNVETQGAKKAYARTELISQESDSQHRELQKEHMSVSGQPENLSFRGYALQNAVLHKNEADEEMQNFLDDAIKAGIWHVCDPWGPQDVIRDSDGSFKFVDVHMPWMETNEMVDGKIVKCKNLLFYPDLLEESIKKLPAEKQTQAQVYVDRIMELFKSRNLIDTSNRNTKPLTSQELRDEGY